MAIVQFGKILNNDLDMDSDDGKRTEEEEDIDNIQMMEKEHLFLQQQLV
jgi:hypothetical protein